MNKETYLQELQKALKILPQYDREEAIEFYREYFDEAGEENEAKVISELGEPKALAKKILIDVVDKKYEITYADEKSNTVAAPAAIPVPAPAQTQYADPAMADAAQGVPQANYQPRPAPQAAYQPKPQAERPKEKTSSLKTLGIVLAAIFALPLSPVVFALLIVACVLIMVTYIVLIALIIAAGACIFAGFASIIFGIVALFMNPIAGMVILGSGLISFGIGVFMMIGCVALFRLTGIGLSRLFGRIVHKKNRKNKAAQASV